MKLEIAGTHRPTGAPYNRTIRGVKHVRDVAGVLGYVDRDGNERWLDDVSDAVCVLHFQDEQLGNQQAASRTVMGP